MSRCKCGNGCINGQFCNCCPWCCVECNKDSYLNCGECGGYYMLRKGGSSRNPYVCDDRKCERECKNKEYQCKCTCCRKKCPQPEKCKPPATQLPLSPTGLQPQAVIQEHPSLPDNHTQESKSQSAPPSPPPPYSAIAAVIVAIIVAIILLDLCIFRFPVGRNIRDFLIRKIPFCIAFYS